MTWPARSLRAVGWLVVCAMWSCADRQCGPQGGGSTVPSEIRETLERYINVGEKRPFTAYGPEFMLPETYYGFAKEHPDAALAVLETRLKSPSANVRANAYDFVLHVAEAPSARQRSLVILRQAIETEGFAIQQFVRPAYERLVAGAARGAPSFEGGGRPRTDVAP
jgi:hypothetical protein